MLMLFQSMVTDREELSIPQAYDEGSTEGIYFNTGLLYNFLKFFLQENSVQYFDNYISYLELHFSYQQDYFFLTDHGEELYGKTDIGLSPCLTGSGLIFSVSA